MAISVDPIETSKTFAERLGLSFVLLADPKLEVIRRYALENPDVEDLALHAVYIADRDGRIFYRKVARRRPQSVELLDAIDYERARQ